MSSDVAAYIVFLTIEGRAPSSISTHLSTISFVHKINGWVDPTDNFIVKNLKWVVGVFIHPKLIGVQ